MSSRAKDLVVLGLLVGLMAASEVMAYRFNGSLRKIDVALTAACLAALVCITCVALRKSTGIGNASRVVLLIGLVVWVRVNLGIGLWAVLMVIVVTIFAGRVPQRYWSTLRRAVFAGCMLWNAAPVVLALVAAPHVRWLASPAPGSPEVTVFLLLDEFNASAADPVEAVLLGADVKYRRASVVPFGRNTINVVPALFTGRRFDRAGLCNSSSVCSVGNVLDFSRITVGRQDVDVVGAAMPYCAMRGLRYCEAIRFVSNPFDMSLWRCAAARRWEILKSAFHGTGAKSCLEDLAGDKNRLGEAAIERAPVWRQGGLLYVHLILPHPPGKESPHGTLAADYASNVMLASKVTEDLVRRLKLTGRTFRLVIFSDHPLRRVHCDGIVYARADCLRNNLFDDRVPLFVVGDVPPAFDEIRNNVDVFRLASP